MEFLRKFYQKIIFPKDCAPKNLETACDPLMQNLILFVDDKIRMLTELHNRDYQLVRNGFHNQLFGTSAIDKYIILREKFENDSLFNFSYEKWRMVRIKKILSLYDPTYFCGKRVLELGSGHGEIGAFFAELGANVLCLDGRDENITYSKLKWRHLNNIEFIRHNLETDFQKYGKFDLIVHFGLLYHIENVDVHLQQCFAMCDDMILETVVADSLDPYAIFYCEERKDITEEALDGVGSRPSPFYVERLAQENDFHVVRYFDADLNCDDQFVYDWNHKNDSSLGGDFKFRRFWRLTSKAVTA